MAASIWIIMVCVVILLWKKYIKLTRIFCIKALVCCCYLESHNAGLACICATAQHHFCNFRSSPSTPFPLKDKIPHCSTKWVDRKAILIWKCSKKYYHTRWIQNLQTSFSFKQALMDRWVRLWCFIERVWVQISLLLKVSLRMNWKAFGWN